MSLYVYAVVVNEEEADGIEAKLHHLQSFGIFSDHWCSEEKGCSYPTVHMYGPASLCLGRPMYVAGSGEMERWYGKQKLEGEFLAALIHSCLTSQDDPEGADRSWITWLEYHQGRTVVVVNDNEF